MDATPIIILGLICILIGFAMGSLITYWRAGKGSSRPAESEEDDGLVAIVRLMRERSGRQVFPEFGGHLFRTPSEMSGDQRAHLYRVLDGVYKWLEQSSQSPQGPRVSQVSAHPQSEAGLKEMPGESGSLPAAQPTPSKPLSRPSMSPIDMMARAIQSDSGKISASNKSIAAQIDEILQEKLKGTELEKRAVRLLELPGKGMVVLVGLDQYESVESVPDAEIRDIIRAAVTEWENRMIPGSA